MKAITVRQPWAWAIMHAGKDVENRTRNIVGSYRGPLVIHASKTSPPVSDPARDEVERLTGWRPMTDDPSELGAALGTIDLTDSHWSGMEGGTSCLRVCHEYNLCSKWAETYSHHLILANPRPFAEPIPYRGALGLWEFPDDLLPEEAR